MFVRDPWLNSPPLPGDTVPFGHRGTGREIAYAALFLISNESSYVNAHAPFLDASHLAGIVRGSSAPAE